MRTAWITRRRRLRWLAALALVALGLPVIGWSQTITTCYKAGAQGADGPVDYGAYCWIDFSGYDSTQALGAGQDFRVDLPGGAFLTFTLTVSGNASGQALVAATVPSWSGAAFGNSAFNGIGGKPVLYQTDQATPQSTITLSNLVLNVNGSPDVPFVFVAADGESTNTGESLAFTTAGDPWQLTDTPGSSNPTRTLPTLTYSPDGKTVTETGNATGDTASYVFTTNNSPQTVSASMTGSGLQGIIFGLKFHSIDLAIAKSHTGDFKVTGSGSYQLNVTNNVVQPYQNPPDTDQPIRVVDTLPAGLTYASANGTGWSCSNSGQTVTCDTIANLLNPMTLPPITVSVDIAADAPASVSNTATVTDVTPGYVFDTDSTNNTATDPTPIIHADLSTSTKDVFDVNGGDANPGDTLQYTITLKETNMLPASNVSVSDTLPAGLTSPTIVSLPTGATGSFTGNQLNVSGISVSAGGSVTIVYDATIAASELPGDTIDNTATITNPNGAGATPAAPTVTVEQSQMQVSGNKILYLYDNGDMDRTVQSADSAGVDIAYGQTSTWTMTPAVAAGETLNLDAQTLTAQLVMAATNSKVTDNRPVTVTLLTDTGTTLGSATLNVANTTALYTFPISIAQTTLTTGHYLILQVQNSGKHNEDIAFYQKSGNLFSRITFATSTVIHVDSVDTYTAEYPSTASKAFYTQNNVVYIRAVISDPFGSYDVNHATLTITDANGVTQLDGAAMTQVADSGAATRTFEYAYTLPTGAAIGFWTASVTGYEGTEDTVTHTANAAFGVGLPVLSVKKSHTGNFTAGADASYSLVVTNNSPNTVSGTTTVTDTLPAGLTYVATGSGGTGWSCSASGQNITCTTTASIASKASLPPITLNVAVAVSAPGSIDNTAYVTNPNVNGGAAQIGNTDTATVAHPDLSTSTKDVVDTNGGDTNPGDTLEYTITLTESGGQQADNASVTDDIPAGVTNFTVVSVPTGSVDVSTATGGANGTGYLHVTGITVPANGSVTIVYDVTVSATASPGDTIDNTATITNPNGPGATPAAPTVTVAESQVPQVGNKLLYVYDDASMTRTPQTAAGAGGISFAGTQNWTLATALQKPLTFVANSTVSVTLNVQCTNLHKGACRNAGALQFTAALYDNTVSAATQIGTVSAPASFNFTSYQQVTANIAIGAADVTVPAGHQIILQVANNSGNNIQVEQYDNGNRSTVSMNVSTVINVDSVNSYSAAYPATTIKSFYIHDDTVYVRAVISDPFGSDDVDPTPGGTAPTLTITDANGAVQLTNAAMTQVADSGAAAKTFEYAYTLPTNPAIGFWTASVTGYEGTEGTVTHTANGAFGVGLPVLGVAKSHSGDFTAGANASYSLVVHNNSPNTVTGTTTVTDTLPTGLSYVSGTGTGWTCGATGSPAVNVTCTTSASVAAATSLPAITLTVAVATSAPSSVDNTASVANPNVDGGTAQSGNTDTATVLHPDLSTSTKDVVDENGGDTNPGDTLKYTITLIETGGIAANGVTVTDTLSAKLDAATAVVDSASGCTGAAFTGSQLNATCNVPANGSVAIVYHVNVLSTDTPGDIIDNTATITNPNGPGATPVAPPLTVAQSQVPASGNKALYVYDDSSLTRMPQTAAGSGAVSVASSNGSHDWTLTTPLQKDLTFPGGFNSVSVTLNVQCGAQGGGTCTDAASLSFTAALYDKDPGGTLTQIGTTSLGASFNHTAFAQETANIPIGGANITVPAGHQLVLRVTNVTVNAGEPLLVEQYSGGNRSIATMNVSTVINVDSVDVYSVPYTATPNTTIKSPEVPNATIYVRAVISDPFGSADIDPPTGGTAPTVSISDPTGTVKLPPAAMTQVADSGAATKTFEYAYAVPADASTGFWTAAVTGYEGTEGTVTDTGAGSFDIEAPNLLVMKAVSAVRDPVEDTTRPKALPGATMQYLITVSNQGKGPTDDNSLIVTDLVPAGSKFVVGSVVFTDGSTSSGLTLNQATDVQYFDAGGNSITPVAGGDGTDPNVAKIEFHPQGAMTGKAGATAPSFTITFQVMIK